MRGYLNLRLEKENPIVAYKVDEERDLVGGIEDILIISMDGERAGVRLGFHGDNYEISRLNSPRTPRQVKDLVAKRLKELGGE